MTTLPIEIKESGRFTFRDDKNKRYWEKWKSWSELTKEEKKEVNLGIPNDSYILFDADLNTENEKEILNKYKEFKEGLKRLKINNYVADRSRAGFHVFAKFKGLENLDKEIQKEIRKIYIKKLDCDMAKSSMNGVIALPGRPHFKTGVTYGVLDEIKGENEIMLIYKEQAKTAVANRKRKEERINSELNIEFKDYFEKDKFFLYLQDNVIPDNTSRDMTIFPSLAIACANSGKTKAEIRETVEPIILKNMPGKLWAEFEGWLDKALKGKIDGYNPVLLNSWAEEHLGEKNFFYALDELRQKLTEVDKLSETKLKEIEKKEYKPENKFEFFWDSEFDKIENRKTEWLVKEWIPKGDICFVAGKSSSYKSTICSHIAYAISEGKLVFNKYETIKSKVLYLNEENSKSVMLSMVDRVKAGFEMKDLKSNNISWSFLQNIRLDMANDCYDVIKHIKENDISVLICDSFRRFIGFDENNATEMNALFSNFKMIRKHCDGLTIILLHHHKKGNGGTSYEDPRDMLRGSSDIVNSADSIIGVSRKHGSKAVKVFHIKNRSGEEVEEKIIKIDGEKDGKAYLFETADLQDKTSTMKAEEKCASAIIKYLEDKEVLSFKKEDLDILLTDFSNTAVVRALKTLIEEGSLSRDGNGKATTYIKV